MPTRPKGYDTWDKEEQMQYDETCVGVPTAVTGNLYIRDFFLFFLLFFLLPTRDFVGHRCDKTTEPDAEHVPLPGVPAHSLLSLARRTPLFGVVEPFR